jgi:hypothetical protein
MFMASEFACQLPECQKATKQHTKEFCTSLTPREDIWKHLSMNLNSPFITGLIKQYKESELIQPEWKLGKYTSP